MDLAPLAPPRSLMLAAALLHVACQFPSYQLVDGAVGGQGGGQGASAGETAQAGTAGGPPFEAGGTGSTGGDNLAGNAPASCTEIKTDDPDVPSGPQRVDPDGVGHEAPFLVYCDMVTDGGGWTLLASMTTESPLDSIGVTNESCYETVCSNRAYARLPIGSDFRLDGADAPIVGDNQDVELIVNGVSDELAGRNLRSILNGMSPTFVQARSGSQKTKAFYNGKGCQTWTDFGLAVCGTSFVRLNDKSGCSKDVFAVGLDASYDESHNNCDGWPQRPHSSFPSAFRFWSR